VAAMKLKCHGELAFSHPGRYLDMAAWRCLALPCIASPVLIRLAHLTGLLSIACGEVACGSRRTHLLGFFPTAMAL